MIAGTFLFSRDGGSPDWIPAFAGKHAAFALGELQAWRYSAGQFGIVMRPRVGAIPALWYVP
ncbi:hypothetical protein [Sphingomonas sp. R86520]|uniref:hypothetical protein n=1 Tax=Sphingomonas sp. R86520 TaxID=3093859 RepID=UPI0036D3F37D